MDYEQKYKEALQKIRELIERGKENGWTIISYEKDFEEIYPELKESEDERIRKEILNVFKQLGKGTTICGRNYDYAKWIAWLEKQGEQKQNLANSAKTCKDDNDTDEEIVEAVKDTSILDMVEQKQGWSEEDEKLTNRIEGWLDTLCDYLKDSSPEYIEDVKDAVEQLKSLKERVQPQNNIVTDKELTQAKKEAYNEALDKIEYHSGEPTFDDGWNAAIWYLKKINGRPQNWWKPSDEQMIALRQVISGCSYDIEPLLELETKLKEF